jgi:hypothetical protein
MILRILIGFSIGLAFAACDRGNQYVPGGLDLTSDQEPTNNPVIVCCRCGTNVCQEFSGNVCPAGWKPEKPGNWIPN